MGQKSAAPNGREGDGGGEMKEAGLKRTRAEAATQEDYLVTTSSVAVEAQPTYASASKAEGSCIVAAP